MDNRGVTEWDLQAELQARWVQGGCLIGDERLMLVGREVMTNWARNDSGAQWNRPSTDFIALDSLGHLVVIEVKPRISTMSQAVRAAAQVTAMALTLGTSVSWNHVQSSYCSLGVGRERGFAEAWRSYAGRPALSEGHDFTPVRRVLASPAIKEQWTLALELADAMPTDLVNRLPPSQHRLRKRLAEAASLQVAMAPIELLVTG